MNANNVTLSEHLKKFFGFSTFKGNQEAIIQNVLDLSLYTFSKPPNVEGTWNPSSS